jgi:hypothetical protein
LGGPDLRAPVPPALASANRLVSGQGRPDRLQGRAGRVRTRLMHPRRFVAMWGSFHVAPEGAKSPTRRARLYPWNLRASSNYQMSKSLSAHLVIRAPGYPIGRNSTSYLIVIALIFPRSGGPGGIALRSSNTFSNPPGTRTMRVLLVVFPAFLKACGVSFGRTAIAPLDPLNLLSPYWNSYSPSGTTNVSVSRVCL